mmetsp:Transcript_1375/g.4177  ORF Transcript_1375/g.4177 Transcript_1375/m.4177 type:complete len:217 (+) Transcript_1375:478-1128(+)
MGRPTFCTKTAAATAATRSAPYARSSSSGVSREEQWADTALRASRSIGCCCCCCCCSAAAAAAHTAHADAPAAPTARRRRRLVRSAAREALRRESRPRASAWILRTARRHRARRARGPHPRPTAWRRRRRPWRRAAVDSSAGGSPRAKSCQRCRILVPTFADTVRQATPCSSSAWMSGSRIGVRSALVQTSTTGTRPPKSRRSASRHRLTYGRRLS